MGWTAPRDWTAGEIVTEAMMDANVKNNLRYLKGLDGVPTIESGLTIDNTDGDERLLLPLLSTAECSTVLNAEGEVAFDEQTHRVKIYDNDGVESIVSTADVDDTPANGATTDPVSSNWAYDFINTLTTQGDLPYATAAGTWTRLAKGTATQYLRMNSGATAPEWGSGVLPTVVTKTADETVNNSTVLQDDNHLLLALAANEVWQFQIYLIAYAPSPTAAYKIGFTVPALATYYARAIDQDAAGTFGLQRITGAGTLTLLGPNGNTYIYTIEGIVINGANAGNLQLQWAQNTATAEDTKILANSHLIAFKIA